MDVLLAIKKEMSDRDGTSAPVKDQKALAKEKKAADKAKAEAAQSAPAPKAVAKDPTLALPPAVPVLAPKYTTPAPAVPVSSKPRVGTGNIILSDLDALLLNFSYVEGYSPSKADSDVLAEIKGMDVSGYINVTRWLNNVSSFTDAERACWN